MDIYNATFPLRHVLLKVLTLNKVISLSKRALHAGTIHNKWRKYAQPYKLSYVALWLLGYSANFFLVIANEVYWKTAQICLLQMFVVRAVKGCLGLFSRTQDLLSLPSRPWFVLYGLLKKILSTCCGSGDFEKSSIQK